MLNVFERRLLDADLSQFPLLAAVQAGGRRCGVCGGGGGVTRRAMLRTAVIKYKSDKRFQQLCGSLFRLPCMLAGVIIEKEN